MDNVKEVKNETFDPGKKPIRVRIAPSPTGNCHVGTARTALYNLLFARKYNGTFILRIDDTDLKRSTKESEEGVLEGLKWLGLNWDEGPDVGGPFAPYRQMERANAYKEAAEKLLAEGKAYYCYCSPEELDAERAAAMAKGMPPRYYGKCRELTDEMKAKYEAEGRKPVIRLKVNDEILSFDDVIRGHQSKNMGDRGDFIIVKSDGSPIYNFATVIDENAMQMSHVFRAVEHLSNTFDQLAVYKALGYDAPRFGHMTLMLNPDKSKISKRAGAVYIGEFREMGYLPEAVLNFLALLGWNPGDDREIFSLDELIEAFSVENLSKSDAVFDIKKLDWYNGVYIRKLPLDELGRRIMPFMEKAGLAKMTDDGKCLAQNGRVYDDAFMSEMLSLVIDRLGKLTEAPDMLAFLFTDDMDIDVSLFKTKTGLTHYQIGELILKCNDILKNIEKWDKDVIHDAMKAMADDLGMKIGDLFMQIRIAVTGKKVTPPLFESMVLLGKDRVIERMENSAKTLMAE